MPNKHGGEAAVKALTAGAPFEGLAAEAQAMVEADLQINGISSVVERGAVRLQAAAELYWNAFTKAAESGDLVLLDRYAQRFGWLQGAALRAFDQVDKQRRIAARGEVSVVDVLNSLKAGDNDNSE